MANNKGTVIQVQGPVLDIRFADDQLPQLLNAIEIPAGDHTIVAEVAQHIGDNVVRCIAMSSTDGLCRGTQATATLDPSIVAVPLEVDERIEIGWIGHASVSLTAQAERFVAEMRHVVSSFGVDLLT